MKELSYVRRNHFAKSLGFVVAFLLVASLSSFYPFGLGFRSANAQSVDFIRQFGPGVAFVSEVAVASGGVYVGGDTFGGLDGGTSEGINDIFVRKYSLDGDLEWTRQFGTATRDEIRGLATDPSGVYVYGTIRLLPNGGDVDNALIVRKYSPNGDLQWSDEFSTPGFDLASVNQKSGLLLDSTGVYVVGSVAGALEGASQGGYDGFVRKYTLDGVVDWTDQFGTAGFDSAQSLIGIDSSGLYVNALINTQPTILKYSLGGEMQAGDDIEIPADTLNSLFYYSWRAVCPPDPESECEDHPAALNKVALNGTLIWSDQFGADDGETTIQDVAADSDGVFVVGHTAGSLARNSSFFDSSDMFVRKYTNEGIVEWTVQLGSSDMDRAENVALLPTGIYVAGFTNGDFGATNSGGNDGFLINLNREESAEGELTAATDKPDYTTGEHFTVSGNIGKIPSSPDTAVRIEITNPNHVLVRIDQDVPAADGSYSFSFVAGGLMKEDGIYTVSVNYQGSEAETTFEFKVSRPQDDTIYCGRDITDYDNLILGTPVSDTLVGTDQDDLIRGYGGDDFIDGLSGDDCIIGNGEHDTLIGGPGQDAIYGGLGDDEIRGNDGDDTLYGNDGDDLMSGGDGDDYVAGKLGNDSIFGNQGNDKLFGNEGDDFLKAGDGDDIVFGGEGHDILQGNTGDDRLSGQQGEDVLLGARGNDRLSGGTGLDGIDGGRDHDIAYDTALNFDSLPTIHCEEEITI